MTLEDTPKPPIPELERGDKVVTLAPDEGYTIIPDELYIFNHNKKSVSFYVTVLGADFEKKRKQALVVNLIPLSRHDELAPAED